MTALAGQSPVDASKAAASPRPPRPRLPRDQLAALRMHGNVRPALHVAGVFAMIAATIALFTWLPHVLTLVVCCLIIGALQHHLSIIQHEAIHYLLFTNRRINNFVGALTGHLIFFTMSYRWVHWEHHRQLGHDDDPDLPNYVDYPNDIGYVARDFLWHITGLAAVTQFVRQSRAKSPDGAEQKKRPFDRGLIGVAFTQLILLGLFAWFSRWELYLLLWIVPLLTVAKSLTHFRNVAEHAQLRDLGDPTLSRLRTVLCGPVEGFFFAPMNFNYHAEHHFYTGIPYHQLPRCYELLSARPEYADVVEVERGYMRFLLGRLCLKPNARGPADAMPDAGSSPPSSREAA